MQSYIHFIDVMRYEKGNRWRWLKSKLGRGEVVVRLVAKRDFTLQCAHLYVFVFTWCVVVVIVFGFEQRNEGEEDGIYSTSVTLSHPFPLRHPPSPLLKANNNILMDIHVNVREVDSSRLQRVRSVPEIETYDFLLNYEISAGGRWKRVLFYSWVKVMHWK